MDVESAKNSTTLSQNTSNDLTADWYLRLSKTYYTIGSLQNATGQEKIDLLNLSTAEVLKWLYRSIIGYDLDYEGTFWERLKFSFTS
jgi:hypothetical protein